MLPYVVVKKLLENGGALKANLYIPPSGIRKGHSEILPNFDCISDNLDSTFSTHILRDMWLGRSHWGRDAASFFKDRSELKNISIEVYNMYVLITYRYAVT